VTLGLPIQIDRNTKPPLFNDFIYNTKYITVYLKPYGKHSDVSERFIIDLLTDFQKQHDNVEKKERAAVIICRLFILK